MAYRTTETKCPTCGTDQTYDPLGDFTGCPRGHLTEVQRSNNELLRLKYSFGTKDVDEPGMLEALAEAPGRAALDRMRASKL